MHFMVGQRIGCILADEMGLGKTIQIIALITQRLRDMPKSNFLIVCPATLLENWRQEIDRFTSGIKVVIHWGGGRTGFAGLLKEADIVLTSYETAVQDKYLLKMIDWDLIVLDEAQAVKNPDAQRTAAIKTIKNQVVIAVTGTPIQNNLLDLWSIMDIVLPGYLGTKDMFKSLFPPDSVEAAQELEYFVSPLILRRKVSTVATDLPARIDIPQLLSMDQLSASQYEQIRKKGSELGQHEMLALLTELRMYCTHPFLLSKEKDDPSEVSEKYRRLIEILDEIIQNKGKAIIFTTYTGMIDILLRDLHERFGILVDKIDGRVAVGKRQPIVDNFNNYTRPAVLLLNPVAAGTGLNIAGANHVIHYNPEWNPAVEDQATARAYRRGQIRPVTVHRLIYLNTIEEIMDEVLQRKRGLTDKAIVGVDGSEIDQNDLLRAIQISPVNGDKHA